MEAPSKKRVSERQGRKEEDVDDQVGEDVGGTWKEAESDEIATRRIVRGSRRAAGSAAQLPGVNVNWNFAANAAPAPTPTQATPDTPSAEVTKPAPESSKPSTPVKESTPAKEATPAKESAPEKVATPVKDTQATPTKTDHTPTKESTPTKADTPTKTDGTPQKSSETSSSSAAATDDAPKAANPFAFPSGFSFTNLPAVPFGNLPTATPFGGFPTTNPFASAGTGLFGFGQPATGSIFGPPAVAKQDKEEEGEEGAEDDGSASVMANLPPPAKVMDKVATKNGEEEDTKLFEVKVKLYELETGAYKERGSGLLHLNKNADGKHRLLMRDVNKAIRLNISTEGIQCGSAGDKAVRFVAFVEAGKTCTYLVRVGKKEEAEELVQKILSVVEKK